MCNDCCRGKAVSILYSEHVFVALVIWNAEGESVHMHARVCVCEREGEGEREGGRESIMQ